MFCPIRGVEEIDLKKEGPGNGHGSGEEMDLDETTHIINHEPFRGIRPGYSRICGDLSGTSAVCPVFFRFRGEDRMDCFRLLHSEKEKPNQKDKWKDHKKRNKRQ